MTRHTTMTLLWGLMLVLVIVIGAVVTAACKTKSPPSEESKAVARGIELSLGNPRKGWEVQVQKRNLLGTQCMTRCADTSEFAAGPLGRNEHGGYSYIKVKPRRCIIPGITTVKKSCFATCDRRDRLGNYSVRFATLTDAVWKQHCQAIHSKRGTPDTGRCTQRGTVKWNSTQSEPDIKMDRHGNLDLRCGIPRAAFRTQGH